MEDESFADMMDRMKSVKGGWWTSRFAKAREKPVWFGNGSPYAESKKMEAVRQRRKEGRPAGLETYVRRDGSIGQVRPRYRVQLPNSPFRTTTDEFGYKYQDSMKNQGRGLFLSPSFFYVREDGTLTPSKYEAAKYDVEDSTGTVRSYPVTVESLQEKGMIPEDRRITLLTRWKDQNRSKGTATRRPSDLLQAIRNELNARSDEGARDDFIDEQLEPEYIRAIVNDASSKGMDIGQPEDLGSAVKAYANAVADQVAAEYGDDANRPFVIRNVIDNVIPSIKDDVRSGSDEKGIPFETKYGRMFEGRRKVQGVRNAAAQKTDFERWDEYNDEVNTILQNELAASNAGTLTTDYPEYMGDAGWRYRPPSPSIYGRFIPQPDGTFRADYSEEKKRILGNLLARDQRITEPEEEEEEEEEGEDPAVDPIFERIIRQGTPEERLVRDQQQQRRAERVQEAKEDQAESNEQAIQDAVHQRGLMGEGNRFKGVTDVVDAYQGAIAPQDIDEFLNNQQEVLNYTDAEMDAFKKKFSLVTKLSHIAGAVNNFEDHDRKVLFDPQGEAYGSKDNKARAVDLLARQKKRVAFLRRYGVPVGDDGRVPDGIVRSLEHTAVQSDKAVAKVDEIVNTRARIEDALKRGIDIRDNPKVMEHINAIPGLIDQYTERLDAMKGIQGSGQKLKEGRERRAQRLKEYFDRVDPQFRFYLEKIQDPTVGKELKRYAWEQLRTLATQDRAFGTDDNYADGREPPMFGYDTEVVPNSYRRYKLNQMADAWTASKVLKRFNGMVDEVVQAGKLTPEEGSFLKRNANRAKDPFGPGHTGTGHVSLATMNNPMVGRVNYLIDKGGLGDAFKVLHGRQALSGEMEGFDEGEGQKYVQMAIDALKNDPYAIKGDGQTPLWKLVQDAMKTKVSERNAKEETVTRAPTKDEVVNMVMTNAGIRRPADPPSDDRAQINGGVGQNPGPEDPDGSYRKQYDYTRNLIGNLYGRAREWNFAKMINRQLEDAKIADADKRYRVMNHGSDITDLSDDDWEEAYDLYDTYMTENKKYNDLYDITEALYREYQNQNPEDPIDYQSFHNSLVGWNKDHITSPQYDPTGTYRSLKDAQTLAEDATNRLSEADISGVEPFNRKRLIEHAEEQLASHLGSSGVDYNDFDKFMYDWHQKQEEDSKAESARRQAVKEKGGVVTGHPGASLDPKQSFVPKNAEKEYAKLHGLDEGAVYDLSNKLRRYNTLYSDMEAMGTPYAPTRLKGTPYRGASTAEAQPEPVKVETPEVSTPTDIKPEPAPDTMDNEKKDVTKSMPTMTLREMMDAIRKSDSKDGHPYGKPVQGSVFAYGSTTASYGDGKDCVMPETVPQGQVNGEGASTRKLDL